MAKLFQFIQGDEVVLVRRRRETFKDENNVETTIAKDTEISAVRVPQDCWVGGGTCEPEYVASDDGERKDQKFLTVRFEMR